MRDLSIKRKLTLITMTVSTVALLLVTAGFVTYEMAALRQSLLENLTAQSQMIAGNSTAPLTFEDAKAETEYLKNLSADQYIETAGVYDKEGNLFASYSASGIDSSKALPSHPKLSGVEFDWKNNSIVIFQPIVHGNEFFGTVYLRSSMDQMFARLKQYAWTFGVFLVLSWIITYFLSSRLQRIISRPISHLVQTAKTVSVEKNYSIRAQKYANDELGQLIEGFNEMLAEIQRRDGALQSANDGLEKRVHERTRDLQSQVQERRRAETALQDQFARISLLNQITRAISERQDLESILYVVLRQLEDHLSADLGVVCLFDPAADTFNVAAVRLKNSMLTPKLDLREGMVLTMEQTGLADCKKFKNVNIPDTVRNPALLCEKFAGAGVRSAFALPLMVENKLFAVLIVGRLNADGISDSEREFLGNLSEHVALAAHQARLHTELEQAYNDLRRTQHTVMQQERLKALGQMASGIAHDINNALSPIVGFSDLLTRGENGLSLNGKKYLDYIRTAGEDIAHIVARLREFYRRRDEGESAQVINLNSIVKQVIDMTRPRWRDIPQGRGIMVEMREELDPEIPEMMGIQSEVREALTNLIINATDAIPTGGSITVRTRLVPRESASENEVQSDIILEVADTGIGMDEQTLKHCLEPFFSTKGKRGTGLGLAMVYGVMERHEGKIEVESVLGQGTLMRLIFPVRKLANEKKSDDDFETVLNPLRILCIDDEPLLRELLKELLHRDGHSVEIADNGQTGVNLFRASAAQGEPFDVVITDLGMPYFDGRQVAKVVKRESPLTPVIMLTGWGAFMKEDGEKPAQVDGVISKPPRSEDIRQALRKLVYDQDGFAKKSACQETPATLAV